MKEDEGTEGLTSKRTTFGLHFFWLMMYSGHHLDAIQRKWPHPYSR